MVGETSFEDFIVTVCEKLQTLPFISSVLRLYTESPSNRFN